MEKKSSEKCNLCPRSCGVRRKEGESGYCLVTGEKIFLARAALHFWEEPCISGEEGSGTVFFSGCNLRCVYCQNHTIAANEIGKALSIDQLVDIFFSLKDKGANNINLVTPTHYSTDIALAIEKSRAKGFDLPFVYNCGGYEAVEALKRLEKLIDVYLTDFKYMRSDLAKRYSFAEDYPSVAVKALEEMHRQRPFCDYNEKGIMTSGIIVRHLLLPGNVENAKEVVRYVHETYSDSVVLSLMSQYTPLENVKAFPEINRKVTQEEYDELVDYAVSLGVENAFVQEGESASESFIPAFDLEGV